MVTIIRRKGFWDSSTSFDHVISFWNQLRDLNLQYAKRSFKLPCASLMQNNSASCSCWCVRRLTIFRLWASFAPVLSFGQWLLSNVSNSKTSWYSSLLQFSTTLTYRQSSSGFTWTSSSWSTAASAATLLPVTQKGNGFPPLIQFRYWDTSRNSICHVLLYVFPLGRIGVIRNLCNVCQKEGLVTPGLATNPCYHDSAISEIEYLLKL